MRLKSEFRNRLMSLQETIVHVIATDSEGDVKLGNLFPRLFSVYTFIWCNKERDLLKK